MNIKFETMNDAENAFRHRDPQGLKTSPVGFRSNA